MKFITLTLFLSILSSALFSQTDQEYYTQISNDSDLIVEGQIISSNSFVNLTDNKIYTEYNIQISKIFKGNDIEYVSVVKLGGEVEDRYLYETHTDFIFEGLEGVFFLKEFNEDNYSLTKLHDSYARYYHDGVNHKVNFLGKAIRSYSQLYDMIFNATGNHYYTRKKNNIYEESLIFLEKDVENEESSVNNTIIYSFENFNFSTSTQNLSFDIYEAHNNNEILGDLEVYFKYNTDVFGEFLYANSNITITKGAAIQSNQYSFFIEDIAPNVIRAKITGPCSNSSNQQIVNNGFSVLKEELLKVDIIQSGFSLDSLISFDYAKMKEKSTFYDPATQSCVLFDDVYIENPTVPSQVGNTGIEYGFRNIEITGQSPEFLEFDIAVKADKPGSLFATSLLEFFYNEDAFGSSIFANNKITVTELNGIDQWFLPIFVDDNTAFSIAIQIGENDPNLLFELTDEFTPILHIKIEILDCTKSSLLSFNEALMQGQSEYIDANNTSNFFSYNPIIADDTYDNVLCESMSILDFFPRRIPAGDGDKSLLTIKGNGFGISKGKVFFVNAENASTMIETNEEDISLWTENEIQLTVPSINGANGFCGQMTAGALEPAGSGKFMVVAANTDQSPLSFTEIEIPYASVNYRLSNCKTYRPSLINKNGANATLKGYTFNLGPLLSNNTDVISSLESALCEWNRGTGISWEYGGASTLNSEDPLDNVNLIYEDSNLFNGTDALMRTFISGQHISSCQIIGGGNPTFLQDVDIAIRPSSGNVIFQYDHKIPPSSNEFNFYNILKHELGHAHLLAHALPESDAIMFSGVLQGEANKDVLPNDIEGGSSNLEYSITIIPQCVNGNEMTIEIFTTAACDALNTDLYLIDESIKISPNPSSGAINIVFENPNERSYKILMFNSIGELVYEDQLNIYENSKVRFPENLNTGLYYFVLQGRKKAFTEKIVLINEN